MQTTRTIRNYLTDGLHARMVQIASYMIYLKLKCSKIFATHFLLVSFSALRASFRYLITSHPLPSSSSSNNLIRNWQWDWYYAKQGKQMQLLSL